VPHDVLLVEYGSPLTRRMGLSAMANDNSTVRHGMVLGGIGINLSILR
jgi:hypothetical protein